jgi:hypothetical protein
MIDSPARFVIRVNNVFVVATIAIPQRPPPFVFCDGIVGIYNENVRIYILTVK